MVTIPTIDEISGTTVMNKMRSLINTFITFSEEVNEQLVDSNVEIIDYDTYYTIKVGE